MTLSITPPLHLHHTCPHYNTHAQPLSPKRPLAPPFVLGLGVHVLCLRVCAPPTTLRAPSVRLTSSTWERKGEGCVQVQGRRSLTHTIHTTHFPSPISPRLTLIMIQTLGYLLPGLVWWQGRTHSPALPCQYHPFVYLELRTNISLHIWLRVVFLPLLDAGEREVKSLTTLEEVGRRCDVR